MPNLSQLIDCANVEQIIACAELLVESKDLHPEIRREKVEQVKAMLRLLATQMNINLMATAIYWLAFREDLGQFARCSKQDPALGHS